jgi:hypothetical protein
MSISSIFSGLSEILKKAETKVAIYWGLSLKNQKKKLFLHRSNYGSKSIARDLIAIQG